MSEVLIQATPEVPLNKTLHKSPRLLPVTKLCGNPAGQTHTYTHNKLDFYSCNHCIYVPAAVFLSHESETSPSLPKTTLVLGHSGEHVAVESVEVVVVGNVMGDHLCIDNVALLLLTRLVKSLKLRNNMVRKSENFRKAGYSRN